MAILKPKDDELVIDIEEGPYPSKEGAKIYHYGYKKGPYEAVEVVPVPRNWSEEFESSKMDYVKGQKEPSHNFSNINEIIVEVIKKCDVQTILFSSNIPDRYLSIFANLPVTGKFGINKFLADREEPFMEELKAGQGHVLKTSVKDFFDQLFKTNNQFDMVFWDTNKYSAATLMKAWTALKVGGIFVCSHADYNNPRLKIKKKKDKEKTSSKKTKDIIDDVITSTNKALELAKQLKSLESGVLDIDGNVDLVPETKPAPPEYDLSKEIFWFKKLFQNSLYVDIKGIDKGYTIFIKKSVSPDQNVKGRSDLSDYTSNFANEGFDANRSASSRSLYYTKERIIEDIVEYHQAINSANRTKKGGKIIYGNPSSADKEDIMRMDGLEPVGDLNPRKRNPSPYPSYRSRGSVNPFGSSEKAVMEEVLGSVGSNKMVSGFFEAAAPPPAQPAPQPMPAEPVAYPASEILLKESKIPDNGFYE